jgi:hypothetical protein
MAVGCRALGSRHYRRLKRRLQNLPPFEMNSSSWLVLIKFETGIYFRKIVEKNIKKIGNRLDGSAPNISRMMQTVWPYVQYFSLRTNQHQPSATSQANRLMIVASVKQIKKMLGTN